MVSDIYHSEEKEIWQSEILQDLFPGDLAVDIGRCFLGTPYVAQTLEAPGREKLMVSLNAFDCTTFVETVLALILAAREGTIASPTFRKHLKRLRYRRGKIEGYASRLHYFSDWLADNEKKGILTNITRSLGGRPIRKKINFMTGHRALYPPLKSKTAYEKMLHVEAALSRKSMSIIPPESIGALESRIQNGDIIALAAADKGLDVAHVGLAARQGRSLKLLHASAKEGEVVLSRQTLATYVKSNPKFTGIMVARIDHG